MKKVKHTTPSLSPPSLSLPSSISFFLFLTLVKEEKNRKCFSFFPFFSFEKKDKLTVTKGRYNKVKEPSTLFLFFSKPSPLSRYLHLSLAHKKIFFFFCLFLSLSLSRVLFLFLPFYYYCYHVRPKFSFFFFLNFCIKSIKLKNLRHEGKIFFL